MYGERYREYQRERRRGRPQKELYTIIGYEKHKQQIRDHIHRRYATWEKISKMCSQCRKLFVKPGTRTGI